MGNSNSVENPRELPVQKKTRRVKVVEDAVKPREPEPVVSQPVVEPQVQAEPQEVAPVGEVEFLVLCPCCQSSLLIDPKQQVRKVEKGTFVAQGNIPQSFFKSEFNTQGWAVRDREAREILGLR